MTLSGLSKQPLLVWLFLVVATMVTWWLAEHHNLAGDYTVAVVMSVALAKARTVVLYYMELKNAPLPWRVAFELWVWIIPVVILMGCYFTELPFK